MITADRDCLSVTWHIVQSCCLKTVPSTLAMHLPVCQTTLPKMLLAGQGIGQSSRVIYFLLIWEQFCIFWCAQAEVKPPQL